MTSTKPPNTPGSRRAIPTYPTQRQAELLAQMLAQGKRWVLRCDWDHYLADAVPLDEAGDIDGLSRGHRIAAASWLVQQRNRLHQIVEGGREAPDGWLESQPLYDALTR